MNVLDFPLIQEQARAVLEEACEKQLKGKSYDFKFQTRWSDLITQNAVDSLQALSPNFKFMVSCLLVQKREATKIYSETNAFWDAGSDGYCSATWENTSIICLLHAFATAL